MTHHWEKMGRWYGIELENGCHYVTELSTAHRVQTSHCFDGVYYEWRRLEREAARQHNKAMWDAHIADLLDYFSTRFGQRKQDNG